MSNKQEVVIISMSIDDLEKLIYKTTRKTNSELYKGLVPYLNEYREDFTRVLSELDYIKTHLQTTSDSSTEKPEIDYKKLAEELIEEFQDLFEAVVEGINDNTNHQIAKVLGDE